MAYSPDAVPEDAPAGLKAWLAEQTRRIAATLNQGLFAAPTGVEPARPRDGMIVYADGVKWNPGSGEGFYGYENGSWVKL